VRAILYHLLVLAAQVVTMIALWYLVHAFGDRVPTPSSVALRFVGPTLGIFVILSPTALALWAHAWLISRRQGITIVRLSSAAAAICVGLAAIGWYLGMFFCVNRWRE
jgi:hypothetical protein